MQLKDTEKTMKNRDNLITLKFRNNMLRNFVILSARLPMGVYAQTPQLGKDPVEKVVSAMTLDEKLDLLVGSAGNENANSSATIGNSAILVPGAAGTALI